MAKARILAVDDQRYFRELIAGMLAEEGFEAETASSGEEALHILENADFDIVLTDLVMPGMDGSELVHRIKDRDPEQEIVVVTGVVDVKTAVDAMKLGATDYLLKPFDRRTLSVSLEGILQNRRLKTEHARLLEENIEYIGERTLYERALGIFSTLSVEPLAVRIVEALCLETRAQGGVLWVAGEGDPEELDLAAARGLVRLADEPETIELSELPKELLDGGARTALEAWGDGSSETPALYAVLRRDGRILGLVRLTDKLEGEEFDAVDCACVEKFMHFADVAMANATRMQLLERRSLQDAGTGAYNFEYFKDMVRNEIEKANRFGRSLALFKIDLGPLTELRRVAGDEELASRLAGVAELLGRMLRATDLLAVDNAYRFYVLLAEVDALGAAVLKRRALKALESNELVASLAPQLRARTGVAIFPSDGAQLETLLRSLDAQIREAEHSKVARLGLERLSLAAGLQALARLGSPERAETAEQLAGFVLDEVARHPRERGLVYVAPGIALGGAVRRGLELLRDVSTRTDVVVIGEGERPSFAAGDVSWISSQRAPGLPPCLIHYRDGPAYALVREEGRNGAPARLFHTSDRSLVEHLAFRLQEELAVPLMLGHEGERMSALVLIADGDAERGREIADACIARGLECRVTMHGAAALEAALSEVPQVLVGQLGLPLIDSPKLAAILHANPRTQGVSVLFVADRPGDAERRGLVGQLIPPPVEPDVVAGCVQTVLGERGEGRASPGSPDEEGGVDGQLAQLPLADLLQLFHVSRKTGTVEVMHGPSTGRRLIGRVVLRGGDVVAAAVGSVDGEKALFRLLAWDRGSFSFKPEPVAIEPSIQTPTRDLLREGLRQLHEWQRLAVDLPPLSASVTLKIPRSTLPNVIHPLTQEVLVVLDLYSRVQDVVDKCSYPDYQVLRTLHTLVQRGMVELQPEPEATELAREVRLFSPARTARLREWLEIDRPGTPSAREAKLLVVSSDENATRDFSRLFRCLPGVELDSRIERGGIVGDDLLTIGRVAVDAEVGIDLVHVPAAERFAPLWPVAGHGALATLLLLSGAVGRAVASVRAVADALGALPRARMFHLLLLEKGERVSPEDLRQNLSIVDDGSLFLIPLESPEKAGVLLREMFGRILP